MFVDAFCSWCDETPWYDKIHPTTHTLLVPETGKTPGQAVVAFVGRASDVRAA